MADGGGPFIDQLRKKCAEHGQDHLLEDWDGLTAQERQELAAEIEELDFAFLSRALRASKAAAAAADHSSCQPARDVITLESADAEQRASWRRLGLQLIAQGKVGVLLLAGGQGTRLGSTLPKGCYDVGLPSRKSLFQLQAERLLAVQRLAAAEAGAAGAGAAAAVAVPWFVMTSPFTHKDTVAHFEAHGFFGLDPQQVVFFQQGFLPCVTEDGRVVMETRSRVAKAPDGNGGLYRALQRSGALAAMRARGVEALDVYCVDNVLARLADPEFIGACSARGAELGARVLAKAHPAESVGVFARDAGGGLRVLEYSELDPALAAAPDPSTGRLLYNWSNVCMHFFSLGWLEAAARRLEEAAEYHLARKQVPAKGGARVPAVKLEMFIFDPFGTARGVALFEVERRDHFAPVKNAPGSAAGDSPDTARAALLAQGARWVQAAGGRVAPGCGGGVEVSPLASYAGEGLEPLVGGREVGPLVERPAE